MKKIIAIILVLVYAGCICGCSKNESEWTRALNDARKGLKAYNNSSVSDTDLKEGSFIKVVMSEETYYFRFLDNTLVSNSYSEEDVSVAGLVKFTDADISALPSNVTVYAVQP